MSSSADRPTILENLQYHLHTSTNYLSPLCLIVGAPGRVDMIGEKFLTDVKRYANDHRGLVSISGKYSGVEVSVTTSGMGAPSLGIVLTEAVLSGARIFIRVGSCGSLIRESRIGDVIVVNGAIRYDGASETWAPLEFPAFSDYRIVHALVEAASKNASGKYHLGIECTTSDFNSGQGRPNLFHVIPERMKARHDEVMRLKVSCYSMEAAALFVWCATEGGGLPCGAINAVFANRKTKQFGVAGEELAALVALEALLKLSSEPSMQGYISRKLPVYPSEVREVREDE